MLSLNQDHVREVMDAINEGPYFKHLSMTVKEMGEGFSIVELDMGNEHLNPFRKRTIPPAGFFDKINKRKR
jgi:acyl-coenzyme A thioesterase PaaI-like protein